MVVPIQRVRSRQHMAGWALVAAVAWAVGYAWVPARDVPRLDLALPISGSPTGAVELTVLFPEGVHDAVDLFSSSGPDGFTFDPATHPWTLAATNLSPQGSDHLSWIDASASLYTTRVYTAGYSFLDDDTDGLADAREVLLYATDPGRKDTDHDGLEDGDEVLTLGTDPLRADSDGDLLEDGWEVAHGLNPLDDGSTDPDHGATGDPDQDGLLNTDEQALGTSPQSRDRVESVDPDDVTIDRRSAGGWYATGAPSWEAVYPCGDLESVAWGSGAFYSVESGLCTPGAALNEARRTLTPDEQHVQVDRLGFRFHVPTVSGLVYRVSWLEVFVPESEPASAGEVDRAYSALFVGNGSVVTLSADVPTALAGSAVSSDFIIEPPISNGVTCLQPSWGGLTAYRPLTEGPAYGLPVRRRAVPDAAEEEPGAGVRINGDTETGAEENDLVELELHAAPFPPPRGVTFILARTAPAVNAWASPEGQGAILTTNDHAVINVTSRTFSVWMEQVGGGEADLVLTVANAEEILAEDRVRVYPFTSLVVGLGGENQGPTDPGDPNHGIFRLALDLVAQGYDAHLYDEDLVTSSGAGAVYDKILHAVADRGVRHLALFGYSHGAGSIYHLSERIQAHAVTNLNITYTAYVDSVRNNSDLDMSQERRRPVGSSYHVNFYQVATGGLFTPPDNGLDGGPTLVPPGADHEENLDAAGDIESHYTVDDVPAVLSEIEHRLLERVPR